ncbi:hypothetical protein [Pseudonocardia sp. McavD-2-B]|uniref:hypothetical protein n=1 Tax=Pseudonocardia sp. McavD-2-B TaxID=2954499 RepID=UPI002097030E|nr:hypothetical protein [Pseudonocardia sp. McavD-2-B]MCO7195389.1 hypothetical protein [Pseudonocardia sp. McavD-2-B]
MPRYRNTRTAQVVERRHPDARLDALAVWERLDEPEQPATPAPEPAPEPEPEPDEPAEPDVKTDPAADEPEPPARSANRDAWEQHARTRGATEAEIDAMTKPQLVERYG